MSDIVSSRSVSDGWQIRLLNKIRYVTVVNSPTGVGLPTEMDEGFTITYGPTDTTKPTFFFPYAPEKFDSTVEQIADSKYCSTYSSQGECLKCTQSTDTYLKSAVEPIDIQSSNPEPELGILCQQCLAEFQREISSFMEQNKQHILSEYI